jgi:hypothetical protein
MEDYVNSLKWEMKAKEMQEQYQQSVDDKSYDLVPAEPTGLSQLRLHSNCRYSSSS